MYARLKDKQPINPRDPLFAALFENADKIHVKMEDTPRGSPSPRHPRTPRSSASSDGMPTW
jgi:hypothetical protein